MKRLVLGSCDLVQILALLVVGHHRSFPFSFPSCFLSLPFSLDFLELQLLIYRMEERALPPNTETKESIPISFKHLAHLASTRFQHFPDIGRETGLAKSVNFTR